MTTYLDELLAEAHRRVAHSRAQVPLEAVRDEALAQPPAASFAAALQGPGVAVIAEVKRASPSRGVFAANLDAVQIAEAYRLGGAAAVSVLTEPRWFHGSLDDLRAVAERGITALRKDFVVDPYQVWQARAAGASAVLLIVAALEPDELADLHAVATQAGLDVLVEVHDEAEAAIAVEIGAHIVGVNARNLRTFELDRDLFATLRPTLGDILAVAESGVRGPDDVRRLADVGADAVLVGESLVVADDPAAEVAALVAASSDERDSTHVTKVRR